ncbi:MAG: nuclear transport factor 2 family protein [Actinomycetota bacterium]
MAASVVDRLDIAEVKYRYALGLDTRNWELYRSIFTDRVDVDFSSYDGGEPSTMDADDWVGRAKVLFTGLDSSHHQMTNPMIEVDVDEAELTMYLQAQHLLVHPDGDPLFTIGGYYRDRLVRTDEGWRLSAVRLVVLWTAGNRDLMRRAAALGRERLVEL